MAQGKAGARAERLSFCLHSRNRIPSETRRSESVHHAGNKARPPACRSGAPPFAVSARHYNPAKPPRRGSSHSAGKPCLGLANSMGLRCNHPLAVTHLGTPTVPVRAVRRGPGDIRGLATNRQDGPPDALTGVSGVSQDQSCRLGKAPNFPQRRHTAHSASPQLVGRLARADALRTAVVTRWRAWRRAFWWPED